jgi:HD domain-containing protein
MISDRPDSLAPLLAKVTAHRPGIDTAAIEDAYRVAELAHRGQFRRSGDPYLTHPVTVGRILAEQGARPELVCAALLHDVDHTDHWLRDHFGPDVAALVTGLRRLDHDLDIAGTSDDVLLLKLADRLHNMQTISFIAPEKQAYKAAQTLDLLVPLASRLGAHDLGRELSASAVLVLAHPVSTPRMLKIASALLPSALQPRWVAEWSAELATLESRRARLSFVLSIVLTMPALAYELRRPPGRSTPRRTVGITIAGGISLAATADATTAWAAATVALAVLAVATAVLFAGTDDPVRRIREIVDSWRGHSK